MDVKQPYNTKNEVKCGKCQASIRIKALIKLKDRYCCPLCFSTIKIEKEK